MKLKIGGSVFVIFVLAMIALTTASPAVNRGDATLTSAPARYIPRAADLAWNGETAGDAAEADVQAVTANLDYTGLILNADGVNANAAHPFLKVQGQTGTGNFSNGGCYLGNNASAGTFGLSFFTLTQEFNNAHMRASRDGSTVTIEFTNVNGGTLANQTYVCTGAPAPVGDKLGVLGYSNNYKLDNFSNGSVLDNFSFVGALASSGRWTDAAPGMNADGSRASGGFLALSFFTGSLGPAPTLTSIRPTSGAQGKTVFVKVRGTNFEVGATTVRVSGNGVSAQVVNNDGKASTTYLTAKLDINIEATTGVHDLTVSTRSGGTSNALSFTVTGAAAR